jgi:small subunit ribosomal protein S5
LPLHQRRNYRDRESNETFNIEAWEPKTQLGKDVKLHKITSIEEIFHMGKPIQEPAMVDALLPNIKSEVIEIASVQRTTRNGRKQKFRATVIVGDGNGHVGVGAGKDIEVKAAITSAVISAKRHIIPVMIGCGSWQCLCGTKHSMPFKVEGRCGSVEVMLKPAPRGIGIVASEPVRKLLTLAGVKDAWSFSRGRTKAKYNTMIAVYDALNSMNKMKNVSEIKQ